MAAVCVLGAAALAFSCAKLPLVGSAPAVSLHLTAGPQCNSCGKSRGYTLHFRILQVKDATALAATKPEDVWDHEEALLGGALLKDEQGKAVFEDMIDPGATKTVSVPRIPKAAQLVFLGNFCKTQGSCWYLVKPLKGRGGSFDLFVDNLCVSERRR
jgi:type VI secretion system VasD/TssJ family lipoprotein